MNTPQSIIIAASIIGVSIVVSSGFYEFSSPQYGIAHRYNKFTGRVDMCVFKQGCNTISQEPETKPETKDTNPWDEVWDETNKPTK